MTENIMNTQTDNVIETKAVTKVYETGSLKVRAVDSVSMSVRRGEFVALVGPSGSGKTTMLAILAALLTPTEGLAMIDGVDLSDMKERDRVRFRRKHIGFTFQSNNLVPYLNVVENVELMMRLNGCNTRANKQRTLDILDRLGLSDRLKNLPSQLSGGQRQRVAIARALIHNPSVVLADEPTASLDTERANQVTENFANLIHEEDKGGIMVTHDLRMCAYVDRLFQMEDGHITKILKNREEIDAYISCG